MTTENNKKTIGVQTYTDAKGKRAMRCFLIGHRWEDETFSGGVGETDESVTHLTCKNSGCQYDYYEFRNYPYLTETKRIMLAEGLGNIIRTLNFLFGETYERP